MYIHTYAVENLVGLSRPLWSIALHTMEIIEFFCIEQKPQGTNNINTNIILYCTPVAIKLGMYAN